MVVYQLKHGFNFYPEFELEFGETAALPMVKTNHFGMLGLDNGRTLMTEFAGNETVQSICLAWLVKIKKLSYINFLILISVNCLDLSCCSCLISGHLEQLSISCQIIQKLNLQYSEDCLKSM